MAAYGDRQPLSRSYLGNDGPSTRGILGDSGVHYDAGGRLVYPGQQPDAARGPTSRLFWRGGDPMQLDEPVNNFRYRPWNRTVLADPSTAPIIPRRFDGVQAGPIGRRVYQPPIAEELPYTTSARLNGLPVNQIGVTSSGPTTTTTAVSRSIKTTMAPETIIIEEMRIYDDKPCLWWLHLIVGLLMIGVGVANIIICFDYLYFNYLWTGISLVIFAIICNIHRGDYVEKKWKTRLLIVWGFVTTAFELAATWLVVVSFSYNSIELAEVGQTEYISTWKYRYGYFNSTPLVTVNEYKYNIFICYALNAVQIVLLMVSYLVLSTTLMVIDRYYNSHFIIHRKVEPFCEPWLFNPWGQCSVGQAMVFVGCVVGAMEHGNDVTSWFELYSPSWAGAFPIFAGIASALSLKTCDRNRKWEHWLAVLLEILSIIASVVCIIFMVLDLIDNITTLSNAGGVMLNTSWDKRTIVVSSIAKGVGIIISVVNLFYSGTLVFRVLRCICSNMAKSTDENDDKRYVLEESDVLEERMEQKVAHQREAAATTAATTYNTNNNNLPVFTGYRPMGTRSFYM